MEKILVIDDEPIIRESMTAYLEDSGFRVCQASDGREGLAVFRREQPDLVMVEAIRCNERRAQKQCHREGWDCRI